MKKFLKVITCFMFVVLATLGFAGCTKKISLESAFAFIDSASETSGLDKGIEYQSEDFYIKATFDEDGSTETMYYKSTDGSDDYEIWLNNEYVYVKNNKTETKQKARIDAAGSLTNYLDKRITVANYKNIGRKENLKENLAAFIPGPAADNFSYSIKKINSSSNTKIILTTTGTEDNRSYLYSIAYTFKNKTFVSYDMSVQMKNLTTEEMVDEKTTIKQFTKRIEMPTDADGYEDVSTESE